MMLKIVNQYYILLTRKSGIPQIRVNYFLFQNYHYFMLYIFNIIQVSFNIHYMLIKHTLIFFFFILYYRLLEVRYYPHSCCIGFLVYPLTNFKRKILLFVKYIICLLQLPLKIIMLERKQLAVATRAIGILMSDTYNVKLVHSWMSPILLLNGNCRLIA